MEKDDLHSLTRQYKQDRNPKTLERIVQGLQPTIDHTLYSLNTADDPVVRNKAWIVAAKSVDKYDPDSHEGVELPTFVSSQLRQLTRDVRHSRAPIQMPERIQLDAYKMNNATRQFEDEHGREPDMLELADYTGMPMKRLKKLNQYQFAVPTEESVGEVAGQQEPDYSVDAMEMIYHDSDHTDRKIMELKMGYGGFTPMTPKDVATKLNLTPTQLSRRSMRIAKRISELESDIQEVNK